MNWIKKIQHSFSAKLSFYVLLCVVIIFLLSFLSLYLFASRSIRESANDKAKNRLEIIQYKIENVFSTIETVHNNIHWTVFDKEIEPDTFFDMTRDIVKNNQYIFGCAVAFEPYYFKEKGYYFAPFSSRQGDTIYTTQLGTNTYDYFEMEWYDVPKCLNEPFWSDPYYDVGGGKVLMMTYSTPLFDKNGTFIGVLTADVSLDWLTDMVNEEKPYKSSYSILFGRDGICIVHPRKDYIMTESVFSLSERLKDKHLIQMVDCITKGEAGSAELKNTFSNDLIESYAYYKPLRYNGWYLVMIIHKEDVFKELNKTKIITILLLIAGLVSLFVFCLFIVNKLTKPMRDFSRSARKIAQGNFNVELPQINSKDEMLEMKNSFVFMQKELANYVKELQETTSKKERIESELRIANEIQMGMIPKIFPPFPERDDIDLFAVLHTAREVGGDLYDFFIDNEKLYFAIGDVSGKGVPASLFMAVTRSLFRSIATLYEDPGQIVSSMNKSISETNDANMFITLFIGVLDLLTGELRYCNAGHNPPILKTNNGNVSFMTVKPNIPVGLFENFSFQSETMTIGKDTILFLYTDGLTEAENIEREFYKESRLIRELETAVTRNPKELIHSITESVSRYVDGAEQSDDLTILVLHYN
ncbi:sigma-B regulation protein RsbU (phosphoserine phosphatase) [Dysgonomonadaceae bacterium PH5-43]|nr:sigma-B regulation protein RsbU (phosphoserine phosphatase) [Dysgonomonadaceae bacterium PH5-43]